MPQIRDRIFLATKTGRRDRESAWREINASLERLQTDRVDLLQLHAIGDLGELDLATGPDGALEAAVRALDEGLVGAVGVTGHGDEAAQTHLEALRRYPFATVLTPLNPVLWRDHTYRAAYLALVEETRRQDAGLMTIKTVSRRNWPDGADHSHATWYEPYHDQARSPRRSPGCWPTTRLPAYQRPGTWGCWACFSWPSGTGSLPAEAEGSCPETTTTRHRSSRCRSEPCTGSTAPGDEVRGVGPLGSEE